MLAAFALSTGAVVRLAGGPPAVYEATTWLLYAGAVVIAVGAVRNRLSVRSHQANPR